MAEVTKTTVVGEEKTVIEGQTKDTLAQFEQRMYVVTAGWADADILTTDLTSIVNVQITPQSKGGGVYPAASHSGAVITLHGDATAGDNAALYVNVWGH